MSWGPRKRRPSRSLDDVLIKIAAAIVVAFLLFGGWRSYRSAQAAEASAIAMEQARQQGLAAAAAARQAEQHRLDQWAGARVANAQETAQPAMYRCRDASGVVAIQSWPCAGGADTEWSRTYEAQDARAAADADRRAAEIARHEAEVAQYTQMYGDRPAAATYSAAPQASGNSARCAAAKAYRDGIYRQVGNNRTFNLIRQLDDYVYENCKGT